MIDLIEYDFRSNSYVANQSIPTDCIDLIFVNTGTAIVYINQFPLQPQQDLQMNGNIGEVMRKSIDISFDTTGTPQLWVVRRFYTAKG